MNLWMLAGLVALAGSVGSLLRWAVDVLLSHRVAQTEHSFVAVFPWALLLVNVVGSFVCGVATAQWGHSEWGLVLATGLAGGLTTMSTLAVTSANHLRAKKTVRVALWSLLLHLVLGVSAAWLGLLLGGNPAA
ncbi:CrcB protein [Neomicrococcus aestuarii]|uniref:Fluoride-specific ion channel FluC n=1 Tax=Neomicrococcus aestuarii TaxID=556325 RepID=A0A7W8WZX3_9MICC|nr:CrcB family protein [Neomicrococcus aestuarii]MBB5513876.1 CrcB protein [Neomicrococcus aestuarii]